MDDMNIAYVKELIAKETGILTARLDALDRAITIAATELARRLELLNRAHEQAIQDRTDFVTREVFNEERKQFERFRQSVSDTLAAHRGRDTVVSFIIGVGASAVIGIMVALIHMWWGRGQ